MNDRKHSLTVAVLVVACSASCLAAEEVEIAGADGRTIALDVRLPEGFDPATEHSVIVGPGDYYWQGGPPPAGWILVLGDAFYGPDRIANSNLALKWIEDNHKVRGGGFHIAGWSANSAGVFEIAMTYPDRFLSVTGVAGMPGRGAEADLDRLKDVRVQFIVGSEDSYWRDGSNRWHELMLERGIESRLEIIPDGEHVMVELVHGPMFDRMNRLVADLD